MGPYSYDALVGRPSASSPALATDPDTAAANTNGDPGREADGGRAMLDLRSSPAAWYVVLVIGTAALAKSLGIVRAG